MVDTCRHHCVCHSDLLQTEESSRGFLFLVLVPVDLFRHSMCFLLETDSVADQKARKTGRENVLCQSFHAFFWDLSGSFLHHTGTALELELCN